MVTKQNGDKILVGTESIIDIVREFNKHSDNFETKIQLRHAMVTSHRVVETVEEIYNLYKVDQNEFSK